jgi:hypothetical protein
MSQAAGWSRPDTRVLFVTAWALLPGLVLAQSTKEHPAAAPNSVSTVQIQRENVFDKSETEFWLARIANALHIVTREPVVARELLVEPGKQYDSATAAETARNLRKLGIFRDVTVDSATTDSGLQARVTTRDSWTTQIYASFKSAGDQITWGAGVTEKNLLGRKIKLNLRYTDDPDRSTVEVGADAPRIFPHRFGVAVTYKELSDGKNSRFTVSAPFTSSVTPQSLSFDSQYFDGDVLQFFEGQPEARDTLRHLMTKVITGAGWTTRGSPEGFFRIGTQLQFRREDFTADTISEDERSLFGELEVSVETSRTNFTVINGYKSLGREDVDLSRTFRVGLWLAPSGFGYDRTGLGLSVSAQLGKSLNKGFATVTVNGTSLFTRAGLDSGGVKGGVVLALQPAPRHSVVLNADAGVQKNPLPGGEFDLGLTFGPRGFPAHSFTGDRAFFTTAEYRWVAVPEVFKLLGIGLAAFVDYGGAWYAGSSTRTGTDYGVGIRLGSTRSASGKGATRIDLTRRVANDVLGDKWVIAVGAGFPFDRPP